jgi:hypothetical protein
MLRLHLVFTREVVNHFRHVSHSILTCELTISEVKCVTSGSF